MVSIDVKLNKGHKGTKAYLIPIGTGSFETKSGKDTKEYTGLITLDLDSYKEEVLRIFGNNLGPSFDLTLLCRERVFRIETSRLLLLPRGIHRTRNGETTPKRKQG